MKKPYDKNKIGKFIGWGGEHLVYEYEKDKVIKFSLHIWLSGRKAVEKKMQDYQVGKHYFSKYLLQTDILAWDGGKRAIEIQKKIKCRFLHKDDLRIKELNEQFHDLMQCHQKMLKETNTSMDFIGREGLLKAGKNNEISNVLVTLDKNNKYNKSNQLVLIDFTLLKIIPKFYEWPLWLLIEWAKRRQKKLLKKFIK